MNEDKYLKESVSKCVEHFMKQNEETKERIVTGLFTYIDRLVNESILVQAMNDKEKQEWFNSEFVNLAKELQQRINKAIEYIKKYQEIQAKYCYVDFDNEDIDKLLEILGGDSDGM